MLDQPVSSPKRFHYIHGLFRAALTALLFKERSYFEACFASILASTRCPGCVSVKTLKRLSCCLSADVSVAIEASHLDRGKLIYWILVASLKAKITFEPGGQERVIQKSYP